MRLLSAVASRKPLRIRSFGLAALVSAFGVLAVSPTMAGAFSVGPFVLSPQGPGSATPNLQAGADADLASNEIVFGGYASSTDTLKDLVLQLAPGLLVNPSTIPAGDLCTSEMLTAPAPSCPPGGLIGTGTLNANVGALANQTLTTSFYLMAPPTPADAAGVAMIVSAGPVPLLGVPGRADVNANGTLQITFSELPQSATVAGVPQSIQIIGAQLTVNGTVMPTGGGQVPFTRLPTHCAAATSTVRADAYSAPGTFQSQNTQFTPTGCAALAYAPQFTAATATVDTGDPGVALTTTFSQGAGPTDSALSAVSLMLPFSALAPNAGALIAAACNAPLAAACSPVGTATVSTPLLGAPLSGKLYAVQSGGLPGLSIVLPPPVAVELDGVTTVGAAGELVETFAALPDLPIHTLTVAIASTGINSALGAGPALCLGPVAPMVAATFTPQDGGSPVATSVSLTRLNCPAGALPHLPSATLTLPDSQIVSSAGGKTGRVAATCTGASCRGTLTLMVSLARRPAHGKHGKTRYVRVSVASGTFSLAAGSGGSSKITVRLTRLGKRLLKRHHMRLKTSAVAQYGEHPALGSVTLKGRTTAKR